MNMKTFACGLPNCSVTITKMSVVRRVLLTCGVFLVVVFPACNSKVQNEAKQMAEQIKSAVTENHPGAISTKETGYRMKARIDGKLWEATSMMPLENINRVIGYLDGSYIGFPLNSQSLKVGRKIEFNESNVADLSMDREAGGLWGGKKGEAVITKMDDQWIEGTFYFTGSGSSLNKIVEVTDGFFRVAMPANAAR